MNDLSDLQSHFAMARTPRVSVVLVVRDGVDDLADRIAELAVEAEFAHLNLCEMILVDDGSRDLTWAVLQSLVRHEPRLRPLRLRGRFGEAAAREAGVLAATGDIIITLAPDAPVAQLGQLAGLIEAEHDVVATRRGRTGLSSGTAAYRREVLAAFLEDGMPLPGLPLAARRRGYRVGELRLAPGGRTRLSDAATLVACAVPALASERAAGLGLMLGTGAMLAALPLSLLSFAGAAVCFLAGLQLAGFSVLAGLLLRGNRRARARARIAETLRGHGGRD